MYTGARPSIVALLGILEHELHLAFTKLIEASILVVFKFTISNYKERNQLIPTNKEKLHKDDCDCVYCKTKNKVVYPRGHPKA